MTIALIAMISHTDFSDPYDLYELHKVVPFEAESLLLGRAMVDRAIAINVANDDTDLEQLGMADGEHPFVFGLNFGALSEGQKLKIEVMTLDAWFAQYKKEPQCAYQHDV